MRGRFRVWGAFKTLMALRSIPTGTSMCDTNNDRIVRMGDMTGLDWSSCGSHGTSQVAPYFFNDPLDIDIDAEDWICVADRPNERVLYFYFPE